VIRVIGYISIILGILTWVYVLVSPRGLSEWLRMRIVHKALLQEVEELKAQNQTLQREIRSIRDDPLYLEYLARSELGMIREGELLFILPSSPGLP